MRTKLLAAAAILAAGLASSMAQSNVYSLNVVGYVNRAMVGGGYTAVANPLNSTNNTFASVLANLPSGAEVLKYNPGIADYDIYNKFGSLWLPDGNATLNPGEGVLVSLPTAYTNTFVGEVLQGNLTNSFGSGYQQASSMVPQAGNIDSALLMTNAPSGSEFLQWNTGIQDFDIYNKFGTLWVPSTPSLEVGESFIISSPSPWQWVRNFTVQ